jgi:hypothetical protein
MKTLLILAVLLASAPALAEVIVSEHGGAAGGICYGVNCGR